MKFLNILKNKHIKVLILIFLVVILLEVFIFNFNSFRLLFGNFEEEYYSIDQISKTGIKYLPEKDWYYITEDTGYFSLEILDINKQIGTIYLDIEKIVPDRLPKEEEYYKGLTTSTYRLYYTDMTSKEYRDVPEKVYVNGLEKSKYITCYLSGESDKIRIDVYGTESTLFKINGITINKNVPFEFNYIRVLIIYGVITLIYSILNFKSFKIPYDSKNPIHKVLILKLVLLFIFLIFITASTSRGRNIF